MNKTWLDRHAQKHGEHNHERRERQRQIKAHGGKHEAIKVVHLPPLRFIEKKTATPIKKPTFFRRMFRRMTGGGA